MGLDLKLLPFDADAGDRISYSHTILNCLRRSDLFEEILEMEERFGHAVPKGFSSYLRSTKNRGSHYGVTVTTPYGEILKYVTAGMLTAFSDHEGVLDNHWNRAIWAYLKELPPGTKVALYWE